jgi:hypothetical protein
MKKFILCLISAISITSFLHAQSFEKGGKYLSLGIGGTNFWHFGSGIRPGIGFAYTPITGQINVQMEFGIHEYVGVGFTTGVGGAAPLGIYASEFNIPAGVIANFHFWQLIANKTGKGEQLKSDKLDLYAGLNLGTGVGFILGGGVTPTALFFAGPQVGMRYFFTEKIAVNGELGYGKSWVNAGVEIGRAHV